MIYSLYLSPFNAVDSSRCFVHSFTCCNYISIDVSFDSPAPAFPWHSEGSTLRLSRLAFGHSVQEDAGIFVVAQCEVEVLEALRGGTLEEVV